MNRRSFFQAILALPIFSFLVKKEEPVVLGEIYPSTYYGMYDFLVEYDGKVYVRNFKDVNWNPKMDPHYVMNERGFHTYNKHDAKVSMEFYNNVLNR